MNGLQKQLPAMTLVQIVLLTLFALVGVPRMPADVRFDYQTGAALFGVLVVVGLVNVVTVRFLVLPRAVAAARASMDQHMTLGCAFAVAPAIYGLVITLLTGQGLLALPFGAIALWGLALVWTYLREALPQ